MPDDDLDRIIMDAFDELDAWEQYELLREIDEWLGFHEEDFNDD